MTVFAYIALGLLALVLLSRTHLAVLAIMAVGLFAIAHVNPLVTISIYLAIYIGLWVLAIVGLVKWLRPKPIWKK